MLILSSSKGEGFDSWFDKLAASDLHSNLGAGSGPTLILSLSKDEPLCVVARS
jgi:hypothetical protein